MSASVNDTVTTSSAGMETENIANVSEEQNLGYGIVDSVVQSINAIGMVSLTDVCKAKIATARESYNCLTDDQKKLVSNYQILEDAENEYAKFSIDKEKADKVIQSINSIGTVSLTDVCKAKIATARESYNCLTDDQKKLVSNYQLLEDAENEYAKFSIDKEKADKVIQSINSIGTVSLTDVCKAKIATARESYNGLTNDQKKLVSNYATLRNCETLYSTLESNAAAGEDMSAAMVAINSINSIGEVEYSKECKNKIDAARTAYESLSASQKALVTNVSLLSSAEIKYQALADADVNELQQDQDINMNRDREINYSVYACLILVIGIMVIFYFKNRKKKKMESDIVSSPAESNNIISVESKGDNQNESVAVPSQQTSSISEAEPVESEEHEVTIIRPSNSNPVVPPKNVAVTAEWVVVGASVKGNGHTQSNMPCQDNNMFESLSNGWGIAIVSDGAGSAAHSDLGSKIVVTRGIFHFKKLIESEGWVEKKTLPTDIEWLQKSYAVLKDIRTDVMMVAQKNNTDVKSLSATCLVVIYSPYGLLTVHVGDGRMGYKTLNNEWKPMMTPHKGEEANQTIFLVSDFWSIPQYTMSGVLVPESIVVREPVKAFALMSDGCENTAWQCTALNSDTGKYFDRNLPFAGFFNPLEETLLTFSKDNVPVEERQAKWFRFIESGTSGFVKEQDDKTMIYAVNVELMK